GVNALRAWVERDAPPTVVVHLGTNGVFRPAQLDELMATAGASRTVVFLTVHVPKSWQDEVNDTVRDGVARYANARLADWHALVTESRAYVRGDRVHCTPLGAEGYAAAVLAATG
ncbi:MAG: hypothetical protein ACRD0M_02020, partial [Acidimicrobiales bacterium]